jgi:hypothetical protein
LNNRSRLFSAKAEESLNLLVINRDELESVLQGDPSGRVSLLERTLRRHIDWKRVTSRINCFNLVTARSDWWSEQETEVATDPINKKIEMWIDLICKMRKPAPPSAS